MAYNNTRKACSVVEDTKSTKLKTLETTLFNKFSTLADQVMNYQ